MKGVEDSFNGISLREEQLRQEQIKKRKLTELSPQRFIQQDRKRESYPKLSERLHYERRNEKLFHNNFH